MKIKHYSYGHLKDKIRFKLKFRFYRNAFLCIFTLEKIVNTNIIHGILAIYLCTILFDLESSKITLFKDLIGKIIKKKEAENEEIFPRL